MLCKLQKYYAPVHLTCSRAYYPHDYRFNTGLEIKQICSFPTDICLKFFHDKAREVTRSFHSQKGDHKSHF